MGWDVHEVDLPTVPLGPCHAIAERQESVRRNLSAVEIDRECPARRPRIGRSLAVSRPWSHSILLFANWVVSWNTSGTVRSGSPVRRFVVAASVVRVLGEPATTESVVRS